MAAVETVAAPRAIAAARAIIDFRMFMSSLSRKLVPLTDNVRAAGRLQLRCGDQVTRLSVGRPKFAAKPLPDFRSLSPVQHLGDAFSGRASRLRRQRVGREE